MSVPRNVFICVPAFGRINCTETTMSLMELGRSLILNHGIDYCFATQTWPDIAELRDMILTLWYDRLTHCDQMLMIDADMGFGPDLVGDMLNLGEPVVAALYPKKTNPIRFVGRFKKPPLRIRDGFVEVDGAGAGVFLIHRSAVTAMLEKGEAKSDARLSHHAAAPLLAEWGVKRIIKAFARIETETGLLAEDLSFCRRHINCGGTVWAAGHHTLTHVGPYGFSGRFLDGIRTPPPGDT